MKGEERDQEQSEEEVEGSGGLLPAEDGNGEGKNGYDGGRHGEAGPDGEREGDEDDGQVGEPLQDVVGSCVGVGRLFEAQVFGDDGGDGAYRKLAGFREEVAAKMARDEARNQVDEAGKDHGPGGLKVEVAAPAILVGQDEVVAGGNGCARGGDRDHEEGLHEGVASLAPVEARVRDEDFDTGDEQGKEAEDGEPVRQADQVAVPGCVGIGHLGMIAEFGSYSGGGETEDMRVLLDDGIDEMLGDALTGHECVTTVDAGLSGLSAGELRSAATEGWDAWVTFNSDEADREKRYLPGMLNLALDAEELSYEDLVSYMPQVAIALLKYEAGDVVVIGKDWIRKLES